VAEHEGEANVADLAREELPAVLRKIQAQYTDAELKAIAAGGRLTPGLPRVPVVDFSGDEFTFAAITDLHMGSVYYVEEWLSRALEECAKRSVQRIEVAGDVTEGMSSRDGHVYELTHIGYERQRDYAVDQLAQWDGPIDLIDGNHDRWFGKVGDIGACIVKDIAERLPNATYLGPDEGNVSVGGAVVKLWHGEDSSSYAVSYRVQKLVEAFAPGEKPAVLLCGHTHKQGYFCPRAVHALSCGALSRQSRWMRSKRMECHSGFWIVRMGIRGGCVSWLEPRWYPFYA
jgi:predicted phosphodiesterase